MILRFSLFISFAFFCNGELEHPKKTRLPLKFPSKYYVKGTLYLPYGEIEEPFDAWYDGDNHRSRIDLYNGMTKTLQRGDLGEYGKWITVDPWSTETVRNEITCFHYNGTKGWHISAQTVIPDVTDFHYIGIRDHKGVATDVYQLKRENGNKVNTYTLHVDKTTKMPVLYKMHGYNNVQHAHYDTYIMEYHKWLTEYSADVFDKPFKNLKCHRFPGWGYSTRILANPMQEYIHPVDDSHVHRMHNEFIQKHKQRIDEDHEERKNIFKHNLRYIHSMNRRNLTYKMKVNHFTDRRDDEIMHLQGLQFTPRDKRGDVGEDYNENLENENVPDEKNWRHYGAVTPVKDQAICGSCWSFGVAGSVEGAYFRKTGKLLRLSQQQQVDCSWGFGNNGCYGGEHWRSYKYIMKHGGLATEEDYGHYKAADGYCHDDKPKFKVNITGYVNLPKGNEKALKLALFKHGPVAVCMDSGHKSFKFYSNGVYSDPKCNPENLGHLLLAVGYGTHEGEPYWLIKNSWTTHWGNDGYVMVSRKKNMCGITTDASYPLI